MAFEKKSKGKSAVTEALAAQAETYFNVKQIHIARIGAYLKVYDTVIIHGDGHMFAGKNGVLINGKSFMDGSDHHKEFNSGADSFNKDEIVGRAKFRAIYNRGDELPTTPEEVIQEFYENQKREMQAATRPELTTGFKNAVTLPDPEEDSKSE